ncbi:MAG TPA: Uma2 family endonuclease [Desulfosporosinus sp.]|nr:Uma2 family endonuclease [Desulfosporosinus sp.]
MGQEFKESSCSKQYGMTKYSYAYYLTWPEDNSVELIEGIAYAMTPAPARIHQKIVAELLRQISNYLVGKSCEVYTAPFDVRLTDPDASDEEIENVVQPDIAIICDRENLDNKGCKGSPYVIIEVVSPDSVPLDYIKKLNVYEKHSVKEYWIIHPIDKIIMVYTLEEKGKYSRPSVYPFGEEIKIEIFEDLVVSLGHLVKEL